MNVSDKYKLRKAHPYDRTAIVQLLKSHQLPYNDITPEKLSNYFMISTDNNPVGAIGLEKYKDSGLLRSLVVSEDHQNNGIGQLLVEKLEEHAKRQGVRKLYLLTTTAASFFNKLDYVEIARSNAPKESRQSEEFCPIPGIPGSSGTV
jgi:amino-acid N-acetyltransferase